MTKVQKVLGSVLVIVMLAVSGTVLAQTAEGANGGSGGSNDGICASLQSIRTIIRSDMDNLGFSVKDIQLSLKSAGGVEELIAERTSEIQKAFANYQALLQEDLNACVDNAEANNLISLGQSQQLRDDIANGTLYQALQSGKYTAVFPQLSSSTTSSQTRY